MNFKKSYQHGGKQPVIVDCRFCDGAGTLYRTMDKTYTQQASDYGNKVVCPVCRGKETIRITQQSRRCPDCNGTGRKAVKPVLAFGIDQFLQCERCHGTGYGK